MNISFYDTRIYRMGDAYKIVYLKSFMTDEYILDREDEKIYDCPIDEKRKNNIIRAKNTVLELGLCNDWDYFVTFTIDKNKYNRFDLDTFKKDFTQHVRNRRRLDSTEWKYVLIPELHKDGAWHLHGLLKGVPDESLHFFEKGKHPIGLVKKGYKYHLGIHEKFGFNSFGRIKDKTASSFYLTKYFSKALGGGLELGKHLYFASLGLNRRELVAEGATCWPLGNTYFNDYNGVAWANEVTALEHARGLK
jgi:hypothetical protein